MSEKTFIACRPKFVYLIPSMYREDELPYDYAFSTAVTIRFILSRKLRVL